MQEGNIHYSVLRGAITRALFDENALTQLIPSYKRFRGAELLEELLDFAILIDVPRLNQSGHRHQFEIMRVQDAVALKLFRGTRMENCEHRTAIANQRGDTW